MDEIPVTEKLIVSGEFAWAVLAIGIFTYDMMALKTRKMETMSGSVWRSLTHSVKGPIFMLAWGVITFHLFAEKNARRSYSQYGTNTKRKVRENTL